MFIVKAPLVLQNDGVFSLHLGMEEEHKFRLRLCGRERSDGKFGYCIDLHPIVDAEKYKFGEDVGKAQYEEKPVGIVSFGNIETMKIWKHAIERLIEECEKREEELKNEANLSTEGES